MPKGDPTGLHAQMKPLGFLVGKWAGEGEGEYPTTASFRYGEEISFSQMGKPFIAYTQRSWDLDDGRPLHTEMGYLRCPSSTKIEMIVAHPTGHAELSEGIVDVDAIDFASMSVVGSASSKEVKTLVRRIRVCGDELSYELEMEAVGSALCPHLRGVLRRVARP